jgi:penicillin-binding protein 2
MEKNDSLLPLFNRPIMAQYAPGSVFKILQALAALSEGLIDSTTRFPCGGAWFRNNGKPACHGAHGAVELKTAIQVSCNAWFAENYFQLLNASKYGGVRNAYVKWRSIMNQYGCGRKLGIDIPEEKPGNIPTAETYEKRKWFKWSALTIYSNSIGQGEVSMTPLQMANAMAMIANRGFYYTPHFVKAHKPLNGVWQYLSFDKTVVPNKPEHFTWVINAMEQVVSAGTGTMARLDSIIVCGKTGTAENPPYEDHSVFSAFAPKENPKIAIGVIVENAGWGGSWAAPIASLIIEKYLTGKIKDESLKQTSSRKNLPLKRNEKGTEN